MSLLEDEVYHLSDLIGSHGCSCMYLRKGEQTKELIVCNNNNNNNINIVINEDGLKGNDEQTTTRSTRR
jgi:hypothetical protein